MKPESVDRAMLQDFVAEEARLLDEGLFDAWDALFADDGWYWLPASPSFTDPLHQASHLYDDRLLRSVHLQRLRSERAHSQQPPGRCHHLLQATQLMEQDAAANRFVLRTPFLYTELRGGRTTQLPGTTWHTLRATADGLRIVLKRVELLHADTALPAVEFYI